MTSQFDHRQWRGVVQQSLKRTMLAVAVACAFMFTGCAYRKAAAGLAPVVLGNIFEVGLDPAFELAFASNEFRVAKNRWPRDYDELSSFLKQTNDKTFSSFQAVKYHRIKFQLRRQMAI